MARVRGRDRQLRALTAFTRCSMSVFAGASLGDHLIELAFELGDDLDSVAAAAAAFAGRDVPHRVLRSPLAAACRQSSSVLPTRQIPAIAPASIASALDASSLTGGRSPIIVLRLTGWLLRLALRRLSGVDMRGVRAHGGATRISIIGLPESRIYAIEPFADGHAGAARSFTRGFARLGLTPLTCQGTPDFMPASDT